MKPAPAPKVPGTTPWARLDNAARMVLTVPKEAVLKAEARARKLRAKRRTRHAAADGLKGPSAGG